MTRPLRCAALAAVLATPLPLVRAGVDSVVTFNEVHYHPPDPSPPATEPAPEWVELHNQMSIRVDLGGWSLRGGVEYTFPEGTVVEPGGHVVISSAVGNPAGALGPFTGRLDNAGEEIRLHERWGRMMDRVAYEDSGAWPGEPDGSGRTLAKRWADAGSEEPASWAASAQDGGTPGAENFPALVETAPRLVFQQGSTWKWEPTGDDPPAEWTQLTGFSDSAWSSGTAPMGTASPAEPPVPVTTLPGGRSAYFFRRSFAWTGTMPDAHLVVAGTLKGKAEFWLNGVPLATVESAPGSAGVLAAAPGLVVGANVLAVKLTPSDDVALDLALSVVDGATAVAPPLAPALPGTVVFNEIAYHARPVFADPAAGIPFAENPAEWIELHNPGAEPVDLTGWTVRGGVAHDFAPGTTLPAGGYLVVDGSQFAGTLSNASDRLRLRDAGGELIDEVRYFDGGRWPERADGGGSTLELVDPRSDRRLAESWAASDETSRAAWQTVTYRASGAEPPGSNSPDIWHEFLLGFLDAGEALVDDVSVIEDPDGARLQLIQNGTFDADAPGGPAAKWRLLGTHKLSRVEVNPDGPGNVLRLVATAELEHTYNNASTTLVGNRALDPARTYEISFRAKWLGGSPQLNSRLYLNRAARTAILAQPAVSGTPGAVNSRRVVNAGPVFDGLRHSPLVPATSQPVRVSVSAADADGLRSLVLHYSVQAGPWQRTVMGGDAAGRFIGVVPGQASGATVQFHVEATDGAGASSFFPPAGPDSRAVWRVGDASVSTQPVRNKMRLHMTTADANALHTAVHSVSNFRWPCTVVWNDREVWYDAQVRLRSAPYGRQGNRAGWNIRFGPDRPFRGVQTSVVIDGAYNMPKTDGSGWLENSLGASVNEMLYQAIANRAGGIPATYDDIVFFQTPRAAEGNRRAQLKMTRFGNRYLEEAFEDGADGLLYKQELIYFPTATVDGNPESLKNPYNSVRDTEIRSFGASKEGWRFNYLVQNNADRDDFARLMALGAAFDSSAGSLLANTSAVMDADEWMRVFGLTALVGLADTYNNGLAHNIELYVRPSDQKVLLFPWDQDHAFYFAPTSNVFGQGSHRLASVIALAPNRRLYLGHLRELCQTAFTNEFLDPVITHLCQVAGKESHAAAFKSWVTARRSHVLAQLSTLSPQLPFAITTNAGGNFSVGAASVTLQGTGWIDVRAIAVTRNGGPAAVVVPTWLDGQRWQVVLPVLAGANAFALTALDAAGAPVGADAVTVTAVGGTEAAAAENLVVSEIHYHPESGNEEAEFVELTNVGTRPVDLTGVQFVEGVEFSFTGGAVTTLAAGQRVLVVRNAAAFAAVHGAGLPVAGEFTGGTRLSDGGERLRVVDRAGWDIADVTWSDALPWPPEADGAGFSLTLIRPETHPDAALPASWRPSRQPGGSPGGSDALSPAGFATLLDYALVSPPAVSAGPGGWRISWRERVGADAVRLRLLHGTDLLTWTEGGDESWTMVEATTSADGVRTVTIEATPAAERWFFRLGVEVR